MEIKNKNSGGYTLVELLVVIASFSIIVITSVDLFVLMISQQRRILAEQELLSQTSYVTEYISRALRMAAKSTDTNCLSAVGKNYETTFSGDRIKFINGSNNGICQEFLLQDGRIQEIKYSTIDPFDPLPAVPLTAQSLLINKFNVKVYGDEIGDQEQPRVVIAIDIERQVKNFQLKKNIQITASQRSLDINE